MPIAVNKASITAEVGGRHNVAQLTKISRDFRSKYTATIHRHVRGTELIRWPYVVIGDTITVPTDSMLVAGIQATRGDDVYHDDPATTELENRIAKLTGKESGLFLVSGTMSNRESCTWGSTAASS